MYKKVVGDNNNSPSVVLFRTIFRCSYLSLPLELGRDHYDGEMKIIFSLGHSYQVLDGMQASRF